MIQGCCRAQLKYKQWSRGAAGHNWNINNDPGVLQGTTEIYKQWSRGAAGHNWNINNDPGVLKMEWHIIKIPWGTELRFVFCEPCHIYKKMDCSIWKILPFQDETFLINYSTSVQKYSKSFSILTNNRVRKSLRFDTKWNIK